MSLSIIQVRVYMYMIKQNVAEYTILSTTYVYPALYVFFLFLFPFPPDCGYTVNI